MCGKLNHCGCLVSLLGDKFCITVRFTSFTRNLLLSKKGDERAKKILGKFDARNVGNFRCHVYSSHCCNSFRILRFRYLNFATLDGIIYFMIAPRQFINNRLLEKEKMNFILETWEVESRRFKYQTSSVKSTAL